MKKRDILKLLSTVSIGAGVIMLTTLFPRLIDNSGSLESQYRIKEAVQSEIIQKEFENKKDSIINILSKQKEMEIIKWRDIDSIANLKNGALKIYLDKEVSELENQINNLKVGGKIDSLNLRLEALEASLMDSPSKALALPLLRIELNNLKEIESKDILVLNSEIATIYDQNKWFIGLMITFAIGIISLAITNFLPKRILRKDNGENNNPEN